MLILLFVSDIASAKEIRSGLGYRVVIPNAWLVLNDDRIKGSPAFQSADPIEGISEQLWQQVKPMILSGNIEMYVRPVETKRGAPDTINVILQPGEIPSDATALEQYCSGFPTEISAALGQSIRVYICDFKSWAGSRSLQLEFDGVLAGTRTMQAHFAREDGRVLVFTATAGKDFLPQMRNIFVAMMVSLEWRR